VEGKGMADREKGEENKAQIKYTWLGLLTLRMKW